MPAPHRDLGPPQQAVSAQVWPEAQFPLQEVGRIVLNENVANFFNENEQLAFSAAHVPPGAPSPAHALTMLHCV